MLRTRAAARSSPTRRPTAALLLYVHATGRAQELRLGPLEPRPPTTTVAARPPVARAAATASTSPAARATGTADRGRRCRRAPRRASSHTLWSTALAPDAAYVTRLRARAGGAADAPTSSACRSLP